MTSQSGPGPDGEPPDGMAVEEPAGQERPGPVSRLVRNKRFVRLVAVVITAALLYYAFVIVLPQQVDWSTVWASLTALTAVQIVLLGLSGIVVMVLLGWAAKASLPGLRLYQGFESSATGQMTAFVVPPPGDYIIRFSMYRTYGFTDEQSAVSVLLAMVLRYLVTFLMPVIGLATMLVVGAGTSELAQWFVWYTVAFFAVTFLLYRVVRSDVTARGVGRLLSAIVRWVMRLFRRTLTRDIEQIVVDFGVKTRGTAEANRNSLLISNVAWGLGNALVLGLALRFSGLHAADLSAAQVMLANGIVMVVNVLPVPGINALIVPRMSEILGLTTEEQQSQLTAALTLYRVTTWILPMMVGCAMFFVWRNRVRRDTVTTVNEDQADGEDGPNAARAVKDRPNEDRANKGQAHDDQAHDDQADQR